MKQVLAAQLAEWIDNNTQGYAKRDGNLINIEGKIDAYELLLYVQSLLAGRTTEQIHAENKVSYTGRSDLDRRNDSFSNAAVEGADW
jgi:hypothetical protein